MYIFYNKAWQSISNLRTSEINKSVAAAHIREGFFLNSEEKKENEKEKKNRTRRWTINPEDTEKSLSAIQKGNLYGNVAQELDMIHKEMLLLQREHLNYFRDVIGCEVANIQFLNEKSGELILFHDSKWFRHASNVGFAGHCASNGEIIFVLNAKKDPRYNRYICLFCLIIITYYNASF
jgi:hypothetical protein